MSVRDIRRDRCFAGPQRKGEGKAIPPLNWGHLAHSHFQPFQMGYYMEYVRKLKMNLGLLRIHCVIKSNRGTGGPRPECSLLSIEDCHVQITDAGHAPCITLFVCVRERVRLVLPAKENEESGVSMMMLGSSYCTCPETKRPFKTSTRGNIQAIITTSRDRFIAPSCLSAASEAQPALSEAEDRYD